MAEQFLNLDEKYKPKTIKDLVGQPHVKKYLERAYKTGNLQHMLFYGPPGVGKTSAAIALAKDLWGKNWQYSLQSFNASDNRGVQFIRSDILNLVRSVPVGAAYQIIFLDEADELTKDAQGALRDIMLRHTDTTKFILSCNYIDKIIDPIKDRCMKFYFKPLSPDAIISRLKVVCASENISYDDGVLEAIAEVSGGSLRKAIQTVDVARSENNYISHGSFEEVMELDERSIKLLLESILASDMSCCSAQLHNIYKDGIKYIDLFTDLTKIIKDDPNIDEAMKRAFIDKTGIYEWRISQGANEQLQMDCYLNSLIEIVKSHAKQGA